MNPPDTLLQRIGQRGDVETFAERLTIPTQKMSSVFPQAQLPLKDHVYILVELPSRTFYCILYGRPVPFEISVHSNTNINGLKEEIQKKKVAFRDHDASNLVLWKVHFYSRDQCFH